MRGIPLMPFRTCLARLPVDRLDSLRLLYHFMADIIALIDIDRGIVSRPFQPEITCNQPGQKLPMSYEFNPESQVFEFPNPYKVENLCLILSGAFMIVAGVPRFWKKPNRVRSRTVPPPESGSRLRHRGFVRWRSSLRKTQ
jgi:hypothetical protein